MKVKLAGYNIDSDVAEQAAASGVQETDLSPEPISAAYARISRDPSPVSELRAKSVAEVGRARSTNRRVVFEMGHSSIAEHSVLNFDIEGISRLAIEWLERFRLCSFTEKSQRYVDLDNDHVMPDELRGTPFQHRLEMLWEAQSAAYKNIHRLLVSKHVDKTRREIDGMAKEDARYVSSLSTTGQLGMTVNARNLELIISRAGASGLQEVVDLGQSLYDAAIGKIPSLIRYPEATGYTMFTRGELADIASIYNPLPSHPGGAVTPINCTVSPDVQLAAVLLASNSISSYHDCFMAACGMDPGDLAGVFKAALYRRKSFEAVLREFEHVTMTFEVILSASAYAQLKRHRISTQTVQPYSLSLGLTIPPSVFGDADAMGHMRCCADASELYHDIGGSDCEYAAYALTNAHRRRVIITMNLRELYHMVGLREDCHAQWDIRGIVSEIRKFTQKEAPLASAMLCGKDVYEEHFGNVFPENEEE